MALGGTKFKKGHAKRGGRTKGTPNKMDTDAKILTEKLVDYGLRNAKRWLEQVAQQNPARALEALTKLMEYRLPKLSKTDTNVQGGVEVIERRIYGTAPTVEILPAGSVPALPSASVTDAEVEEID